MKKLTLIFIALILAIVVVGQTPSTLVEYPYVVKHMSNKDQIFTATVGKYFIGHSPISQGDSVLYYSTSGTPTGAGSYSSPLPIDSINTLRSNGKKVLARIKRGDTYGTITIADSNIVVCSYSVSNTTSKPVINYIDYNGKANIEVKNIEQTYNGYRFVSNSGNDSWSGTRPDSAWASINKVEASTLAPGDNILFEKGDVWRESLTVPSSGSSGNPIVFGAYGAGDNPVIDGADVVTDMYNTVDTTTVIIAAPAFTSGWSQVGVVTINDADTYTSTGAGGIATNANILTAGNFYKLTFASDNALASPRTYNGTNVQTIGTGNGTYIFQAQYPRLYLRNPAAATTNVNTLTVISYEQGGVNIWKKKGITVQPNIMYLNGIAGKKETSIAACDSIGQWYWDDATDKLYIYSTTDPSGKVELGQRADLITLTNRDYVTLKNLTVQHSNSITGAAIRSASGSEYITVNNCTVQKNARNGIYFTNAANLTFNGNTITDNGYFAGFGFGIYVLANQTASVIRNMICTNNTVSYSKTDDIRFGTYLSPRMTNITISGNTLTYADGAGLYVQKADSISIFNNTFDENGLKPHDPVLYIEPYSIGVQSCSYVDIYNNTISNSYNWDAIQVYSDSASTSGRSDNVRIFNNIISDIDDAAGIAYSVRDSLTCDNGLIAYNVITNSNFGIILNHSRAGVMSSVDIFNNTIYQNTRGYYANSTASGGYTQAVLKNNIFYNNTNYEVTHSNSNGLTTSNNLYYHTSGTVLTYSGTSYTAATITTFEPTAQTGDPLFTNAANGDFTLQAGSPAINNGVDVGLTTDILGNPIVGNPDIGAYEYQSIQDTTVFYISNDGDDSNTGLSPVAAWKTIDKVNNSEFEAGDSILFATNDIWREQLVVPSSGTSGNPIVFGAYGTGDNPVIDGADLISVSAYKEETSAFSATLNLTSNNTFFYNIRQTIKPTKAGSTIKVKFRGSATTSLTKITGASIGIRNGATDDFVSTPTRLTFSGNDSVTIPQANTIESDELTFQVDSGTHILVHMYLATKSAFQYSSNTGDTTYMNQTNVDNTLTQNISYTGYARTSIVNEIVIVGDTVENMYATNIATQPYIMHLNNTLGTLKNSAETCISEGDWWWNSVTTKFYIYAEGGNPSGDIELGQRAILINAQNHHYITINNLTLQHSNHNNVTKALNNGALSMVGGSNLTVRGCTIQDNSVDGVTVITSSDIIVDGNTFRRNGLSTNKGHNFAVTGVTSSGRNYKFTNNICSHAGWSGAVISAYSGYKLTNIEISGNTFEYNCAAGAYPIKCDSVTIYNNYFYGNGWGGTAIAGEDYHIGVQSCSYIDIYNNTMLALRDGDAIEVYGQTSEPAHNVRIFYNKIKGVEDGHGIAFAHFSEGGLDSIDVFYNVIDSCKGYGMSLALGSDNTFPLNPVNVYNNVINNSKTSGVYLYENFPIIFKNNIFTNNSNYDINAIFSDTGLTTSNNLYYRSSGFVMSFNGNYYNTTTVLNIEPTAVIGNPLFTNAATGDFSLQTGSPAINAGVDVGLTHDILGNPIVDPDIGAYEYQP